MLNFGYLQAGPPVVDVLSGNETGRFGQILIKMGQCAQKNVHNR